MRFTLEPGGDVDVPDGATLAGCRPGLVRLTGRSDLAHLTLTVDGQVVSGDQVAGAVPWLPGSRVRVGAGPPDPTMLATTAPWHVAVVAGPDAGRIAVPGRDGTVRIGRGPSTGDVRGHLAVEDPTVSREHARVRRRRRRAGRPARWHADDLGSANGTTALRAQATPTPPARGSRDRDRPASGRPARRVRAVGPRGVRARDTDLLALGSTTVALRRLADLDHPGEHGHRSARGSREPTRAGPAAAGPPAASAVTWLVPAVASAALAVATRNPVFLVMALGGPLSIALPALVGWVRRQAGHGPRATADPADGGPAVGGPAVGDVWGGAPGSAPDGVPRGLTTGGRRGAPGAGARRRPPATDLGPDPAATSVRLALVAQRHPPEPGWTEGPVGADAGPGAGPLPGPGAGPLPWWRLAQEGLAVVGRREDALAVTRALLGAALLDDGVLLSVLHRREADAEWAWCRWLERRIGPAPAAWVARDAAGAVRVLERASGKPILLVSDRGAPWRVVLNRWWVARRGQGTAVLLVEDTAASVPGWCRWVLRVRADQEVGQVGLAAVLDGPGGSRDVRVPCAPDRWIEDHARRVAARDGIRRPVDELPRQVALADLGLPGDVPALLRAWGQVQPDQGVQVGDGSGRRGAMGRVVDDRVGLRTRPLTGLVATIGRSSGSAAEPVTLDLLAEGPHTLVAGTTGAGKSELLQSLVLSLALRHPPTELAVVLVDYKGGASFGSCKDLPHVIGQVTDLDPVEAARALGGLRAELSRRERLLAEAVVADLETLRTRLAGRPGGAAPPRLLVVVDEFRALSDELADFVPGLVRLAAQGRSLGIHLVLATQRPAGAVSAEMRANVALRICLRVTDAADSTDVVEVADAATLPVDRPGRALVRRGPARPELVQTAWAALPPDRHAGPGSGPSVRWAPGWDRFGNDRGVRYGGEHANERPGEHAGERSDDPGSRPPRSADHTLELVRMVQQAATAAGAQAPAAIWLPPLPSTVRAQDLLEQVRAGAHEPTSQDAGLLIGLTDLPADQARGLVRWDGRSGALVVAGRPGSGRTTALRSVVHAALTAGRHVHTIGLAAPAQHPGVGTVVGADDPRLVARLLGLLCAGRHEPPCLLVVDDAGTVLRALGRLPRGAGAELLEQTVRDGRHHGLAVAVAGAPGEVLRLLPHAAQRIVLAVGDPSDAAMLGVPRDLATGRGGPGRGVHLTALGAARCQVALPADIEPCADTRAPADVGPTPPVPGAPLRLRPLPVRVPRDPVGSTCGPGGPDLVEIGRGGDDGGPVLIDATVGALVVGPPRSGRSTALATLAPALHRAGWLVGVVARGGPLADVDPRTVSDVARSTVQARDLLDRLATGVTGRPRLRRVVLVDDLEHLARVDPALDELLASWVITAEAGETSVPRVIGATRTDRAAAAYRGAAAALRSAAPVLVLAPLTAGSQDVAGVDLSLAVDPDHPSRAGLGVLVHRGHVTPVQVAGPAPPVPGG
ncbi:FtsK/SpoIIIE domain-containing protein [Cellulomonas sp. KRMCY2]|uniref:FtsK/SpoIIIE domain-containing protein n=1 Tax=Cellulomonas sp. KRMCY2 TaxID=1304865 RepID=UPI00045E8C48|nr:FtsK/SpoIIIE domain-containing protein [Cellulomonas sp. KRMCY2]